MGAEEAGGLAMTLHQAAGAMSYASRLSELGCEPPSGPADGGVAVLESEIGVPLPEAYRRFLAECGGWSGDLSCPSRELTPFGAEQWINGFHDAGQVRRLLDSMITPRNMVTIGWGHFAKYTCLSIAGIDRGSVYAAGWHWWLAHQCVRVPVADTGGSHQCHPRRN
jgi:hypothetical protein